MEIFLTLEGSGWHFINGRRQELERGHLVFIRQPDFHAFASRGSVPMRQLNVAFPCAWFRRFRALLPDRDVETRWLRPAMPPMLRLPAGMRDSLRQRGLELIAAKKPRHVGLARFCLEALALLQQPSPPAVAPDWLAAMVSAMEQPENLAREFAWFQRRAGRSAEHLARECRRCYGETPTGLLNRARVRQAMALLIASDAKVIDVAYSCGFHNLGYFHRTFLQMAGCTPRQWRVRNGSQVPR